MDSGWFYEKKKADEINRRGQGICKRPFSEDYSQSILKEFCKQA